MKNAIAELSLEDSLVTGDPVDLAPAPRALSFTVVHGYLRGEHACAFELHATGCKDLRSKQAKQLFNYEVLAPDQEAGIDAAVESLAGTATRKDIWVQPCTLLKRMKASGRA